jgi:hypothetical protein
MYESPNKAEVKDKHLYITHEYYGAGGLTIGREIIPLEDIECIKATLGTRGGMHTWSLRGYHPEYSESIYKDKPRDVSIFHGGRKNADLIDKIREALPELKYHEEVETGGAPW